MDMVFDISMITLPIKIKKIKKERKEKKDRELIRDADLIILYLFHITYKRNSFAWCKR